MALWPAAPLAVPDAVGTAHQALVAGGGSRFERTIRKFSGDYPRLGGLSIGKS